jgi:short-subunit dehydrogenase
MNPLALVTGASSGIGSVFAGRLAAAGYDLVLVARRAERLHELARKIEKAHGVTVENLAADLTEDRGMQAVEDRIARADNLQLLVNNAGFGAAGRFFEIGVELQDRMHRLHILATLRLTHAALRGMVARGQGGVINVSSVAAFWQSPGSTSYCSTKAWINTFTEGLYLELKSRGSPVKVQALCPGFTLSEFHDAMGFDRKRVQESWWMSAEEVVDASIRGLARGDLIVVPGWRYRLIVWSQRVLPRFLRHAAVLRYARSMGRESPPQT